MRECQNCGNPLPDLATFCNQCWQDVDADGGATAGAPSDDTRVTTPVGHPEGTGRGDAPTQPADPSGKPPSFEAPPPLPTAAPVDAPPGGAGYPGAPPPTPRPSWGAPASSPGGPWSAPGSIPPPPPSWGPPAGAYGPGYGAAAYRQPTASTNGMAIGSLVCSIAGLVTCGLGSLLGVIFGHIGLSQIKQSGGAQPGRGLAIAGLVIGYLVVVIWVIFVVLAIVNAGSSSSDF